MALPTVTFNSSTGSDTAASGAGPATAVTAATSAHTGGVSSTTITLTNMPDLSGVATDGSACLWLNTASGRQFSKITGVDDGADTVTVEDSFTIASGSPVDYAIGGKRATFDNADSRQLFADAKSGWVIETETDQSITSSTISCTSGGYTIRSDSTTLRTITQSANAACFTCGGGVTWKFSDLAIQNTNGTKTAADGIACNTNGTIVRVIRCTLGDPTNTLRSGIRRTGGQTSIVAVQCEIQFCTSSGIVAQTYCEVHNCSIHDNGGSGLANDAGTCEFFILSSLITNNTSHGILASNSGSIVAMTRCCIISGNGGDGISANAADALSSAVISENIITENGGYGINGPSSAAVGYEDFNAFYSNTSGEINGFTGGSNNLTLTADPFTDTASDDFSINNTSGGGSSLRAVTETVDQTTLYPFNVWAEAASGGGNTYSRGRLVNA